MLNVDLPMKFYPFEHPGRGGHFASLVCWLDQKMIRIDKRSRKKKTNRSLDFGLIYITIFIMYYVRRHSDKKVEIQFFIPRREDFRRTFHAIYRYYL